MKKKQFKHFLPIIIKSLIIIGAIIGILTTGGSGNFMSSKMFLFFTIQSNIWIMIIAIIFLVYDVKNLFIEEDISIPQWLYSIKFMFTVAIMLTFIVFSLILTPPLVAAGNSGYLLSLSNIFCHNVVPILALVDWILYSYKYQSKKYSLFLGTILPLAYMFFALIASVSGVDFGDGAIVPYFFLDYVTNGWFKIGDGKIGTFYWIIICALIVIVISYVLILIKNKRVKKAKEKSQ